jgi:hypothetical protein
MKTEGGQKVHSAAVANSIGGFARQAPIAPPFRLRDSGGG